MFGASGSVPSFGPHRSLPPQFCAAAVPARNNINKKTTNRPPRGLGFAGVRFIAHRIYHFVVAVWRVKETQSARMKYWGIPLAILAALSALRRRAPLVAGGAHAPHRRWS